MSNSGSATISRIDFTASPPTVTAINTNIGPEKTSIPSFISLAPDGSTAYFLDNDPFQFAVKQLLNINTNTPEIGKVIVHSDFGFGEFPQIAISPPAGGEVFAYVTSPGSFSSMDSVFMLNITNLDDPFVSCPITSDLGAMGIAVTPSGDQAYVSSTSVPYEVSIISKLSSCGEQSLVDQIIGSNSDVLGNPTITPDQAPLAFSPLRRT